MKRYLIFVLILISGIVGSSTAAEIKVINYTTQPTSPKVNNMSAYFRTFEDAVEGGDYHDGSWLDSPDDYSLEVFSNEPGFKARINAKPFNTPYAEFDLRFCSKYGGSYPGTIDNKLRLKVVDPSNLEYRSVVAYDIADPCDLHQVPKNGDILEIPLPDLVNPPAGVYATWRIETPLIVPGDIYTNGEVDFKDYSVTADEWFQTTLEGENYLWSDVNYDRITDFNDLEIVTDNWLKDVNDF